MANNPQNITLGDLTFRFQGPPGEGPHPVVLLVHGWTGDENSMWVFRARLPKDALLLAPRGLQAEPMGGYSWHRHTHAGWPWVDDFQLAIETLLEVMTPENFPRADFSNLSLVGFSQGAALCYTMALYYPSKVRSIAGLAGFLPQGADALVRNRPLQDKPVFVAHGTQDELVPVERARQAIDLLEEAGAKVTYCEDEVGHKLSLSCFKGLESFFRN